MSSLRMARVAAVSPRVYLGNPEKNAHEIIDRMKRLEARGVQAALFPELCLTGYTCGDLFLREPLQRAAFDALIRVAEASGEMLAIVGLPLENMGRLYNCAAVVQRGKVLGVVPKTHLPNGNEFYETRWFTSGKNALGTIALQGAEVPFGPGFLFDAEAFRFAIEICEDLWAPLPPSSRYAPAGADVIFNPSASNELAAKHEYRRQLIAQQSGRAICGYVYAGAGYGESTTDLVFAGYCGLFENGRAIGEGPRFHTEGAVVTGDIDIQRLRHHRQRTGSFFDGEAPSMALVACTQGRKAPLPMERPLSPLPFVPEADSAEARYEEITAIQTMALRTRLMATGIDKVVIAVSGGLDSTLALLVAARTLGDMGLPPENLHSLTMPGFGTGSRTLGNARRLMEALGCTAGEIDITPAVRQHFRDIGQNEKDHDVTYENSQARERTQIAMDYANKIGAIMVGTGDLSEGALGFTTYNGDHMSMYNVNASIPKTLMRRLVAYLGDALGGEAAAVCRDIVETPISPELLPAAEGELAQRTEDILGDYALHDFFLYHMMDSGSGRNRLLAFARQAFHGVYEEAAIEKALSLFLRRFYQQQYKRSCMPDGPKVGTVSLSPRGDWRMPSDITYTETME